MKLISKFLPLLLCVFICLSCIKKDIYTVTATNSLEIERNSETIELPLQAILAFYKVKAENIAVYDGAKKVLTQLIDIDNDSKNEIIIFQANFLANQTKQFKIVTQKKQQSTKKLKRSTFCRIVPERIDDFAWENDKVAFRTYGPKCQKMFEDGTPGGLISSGIDCWAKRVDYPIINKWYKGHQSGISYHEDHGEGLDAYHVGTTRGCGGIAIVQNDNYVLSENFTSWNVLANGPIRSVFELEYPPIKVNGSEVKEKKRITLDLGSNLYHNQVLYTSAKNIDTTAIGLALHQGKGKKASSIEEGWVSYWEPMAGSEIGTGIIRDSKTITSIEANETLVKDETFNNIWLKTKIKENNFSYWAGFGWKKAGEFKSAEDWQNYLKEESLKKANPINISITKK